MATAVGAAYRPRDAAGSALYRAVLDHLETYLAARLKGERGPEGWRIKWKLPVYNQLRMLLGNPFYAGAYAYGRTATQTQVVAGRARRRHGVRRRREQWTVLIRDHHEGYIPWEVYEANEARILDNANMKELYKARNIA